MNNQLERLMAEFFFEEGASFEFVRAVYYRYPVVRSVEGIEDDVRYALNAVSGVGLATVDLTISERFLSRAAANARPEIVTAELLHCIERSKAYNEPPKWVKSQ